MPLKKLSEADRKAIRQEFQDKRTATLTLARRYGVTPQTIRNVLNLNHYEDANAQAAEPSGTWAGLDKDVRRKEIEALVAEGMTQGDIAKKLAISRPLVSLILKGER